MASPIENRIRMQSGSDFKPTNRAMTRLVQKPEGTRWLENPTVSRTSVPVRSAYRDTKSLSSQSCGYSDSSDGETISSLSDSSSEETQRDKPLSAARYLNRVDAAPSAQRKATQSALGYRGERRSEKVETLDLRNYLHNNSKKFYEPLEWQSLAAFEGTLKRGEQETVPNEAFENTYFKKRREDEALLSPRFGGVETEDSVSEEASTLTSTPRGEIPKNKVGPRKLTRTLDDIVEETTVRRSEALAYSKHSFTSSKQLDGKPQLQEEEEENSEALPSETQFLIHDMARRQSLIKNIPDGQESQLYQAYLAALNGAKYQHYLDGSGTRAAGLQEMAKQLRGDRHEEGSEEEESDDAQIEESDANEVSSEREDETAREEEVERDKFEKDPQRTKKEKSYKAGQTFSTQCRIAHNRSTVSLMQAQNTSATTVQDPEGPSQEELGTDNLQDEEEDIVASEEEEEEQEAEEEEEQEDNNSILLPMLESPTSKPLRTNESGANQRSSKNSAVVSKNALNGHVAERSKAKLREREIGVQYEPPNWAAADASHDKSINAILFNGTADDEDALKAKNLKVTKQTFSKFQWWGRGPPSLASGRTDTSTVSCSREMSSREVSKDAISADQHSKCESVEGSFPLEESLTESAVLCQEKNTTEFESSSIEAQQKQPTAAAAKTAHEEALSAELDVKTPVYGSDGELLKRVDLLESEKLSLEQKVEELKALLESHKTLTQRTDAHMHALHAELTLLLQENEELKKALAFQKLELLSIKAQMPHDDRLATLQKQNQELLDLQNQLGQLKLKVDQTKELNARLDSLKLQVEERQVEATKTVVLKNELETANNNVTRLTEEKALIEKEYAASLQLLKVATATLENIKLSEKQMAFSVPMSKNGGCDTESFFSPSIDRLPCPTDELESLAKTVKVYKRSIGMQAGPPVILGRLECTTKQLAEIQQLKLDRRGLEAELCKKEADWKNERKLLKQMLSELQESTRKEMHRIQLQQKKKSNDLTECSVLHNEISAPSDRKCSKDADWAPNQQKIAESSKEKENMYEGVNKMVQQIVHLVEKCEKLQIDTNKESKKLQKPLAAVLAGGKTEDVSSEQKAEKLAVLSTNNSDTAASQLSRQAKNIPITQPALSSYGHDSAKPHGSSSFYAAEQAQRLPPVHGDRIEKHPNAFESTVSTNLQSIQFPNNLFDEKRSVVAKPHPRNASPLKFNRLAQCSENPAQTFKMQLKNTDRSDTKYFEPYPNSMADASAQQHVPWMGVDESVPKQTNSRKFQFFDSFSGHEETLGFVPAQRAATQRGDFKPNLAAHARVLQQEERTYAPSVSNCGTYSNTFQDAYAAHTHPSKIQVDNLRSLLQQKGLLKS